MNPYNFIYNIMQIVHYPSLRTVLMIEDTLKKANRLLNREQLKKLLPKKVMHQTLNVVLEYLENSGKIIDGHKGILWIFNSSRKLEQAIHDGIKA